MCGAADAYMRGLERRVAAGLSPDVRSVASVFVSRWDKATLDKVPRNLRDRLGIAVSQQSYKAYRDLLESDRWQRLEGCGARPQRLLFASTSTKDPQASDVLYIGALAAPNTVNTMPEETLLAFGDHGSVDRAMPRDGGDCERCWWRSPGPASMSARSPGSCRTKAPRASSIPGRTCWAPSRRRARR